MLFVRYRHKECEYTVAVQLPYRLVSMLCEHLLRIHTNAVIAVHGQNIQSARHPTSA